MTKTKKNTDKVDIKAVDVVKEIGELQLNVQSTLAGISASLTGKLDQLKTTDIAITETEARLKELFSVEKELLELENVHKQRDEDEEAFQKMMADRNNEWADQEVVRSKKWKREEDEHAYDFTLRIKKAQDEFQAELDTKRRQEKARQEELTKGWDARSAALSVKEKDLVDLQAQVAGFDARLKKDLEETVKCLTTEMTAKHTQQVQLLMKDKEAEQIINNEKVTSLNLTIAHLQKQIDSLENQLLAARQDAKEVTSQALQSASGRQANDALFRVMDSKDSAKNK